MPWVCFSTIRSIIWLDWLSSFALGAMDEQQGPWQFEVVAGMMRRDEDPEQVAVRELQEETGVEVEKLIPICDYLVSVGGTDEKMHMYCGLVDLVRQRWDFWS